MEGYGKLNKIVNVTKCCCCTGKTAVLVIGWLGIVFDFGGFITACISGPSDELNNGHSEARGTLLAFIFLYKFTTNGGLLLGVYKERPFYMFPWLCVHCSVALVVPILMILIFIITIPGGTAAGLFILLGLILGLYVYAVLVVHTYYENLRSSEAQLFFAMNGPSSPQPQSPPVML